MITDAILGSVKNLHDVRERPDFWRIAAAVGTTTNAGYFPYEHRDAYAILGELYLAADRLRMYDLDRRDHIALFITHEDWYTLRMGLDWATLNTILREGASPQFRGIPLMLR